MKKFILFLFIFFSVKIYSQLTFKGTIKDEKGDYLENANIQVINPTENKTIAFGFSNNKGSFIIEIPKFKTYTVKVTFLGYNPIIKIINYTNQKEIILNFKLQESENKLKEIILNVDIPEIILKRDTVIYNINKIVDGTEENLKDIIKKLPNLSINENGKILNKGKKIDKLLIDGETFFGDQHQLATENIGAEMVQNIELIKNYKGNFYVDSGSKSNEVALNINLKKQYKNKLVGNLNLGTGFKNKYNVHLNNFSFRKKFKFALIGNLNNTGNKAITLQDYLSFRGGIKKFIKHGGSSGVKSFNKDDIPSFLTESDNVTNRKSKFITINLVYSPQNKFRLKIFSILNKNLQSTSQKLIRDYFEVSNVSKSVEKINSSGGYSLATTTLNLDYRPSNKSVFNYTATANLLDDKVNKNIDNTTMSNFINENINNKTSVFGQNLNFNQKINKSHFIILNFFQEYSNKINKYHVTSNTAFLNLVFKNTDYRVLQLVNTKKKAYGFNVDYNIKLNHNVLKFNSGFSFNNHSFNSNVQNYSDFLNKINLSKKDYFTGLDFEINPKGILKFRFGSDFHYFNLKYNSVESKNYTFLYPKANISFIFGLNHNLSITYHFSNSFTPLESTIQNKLIKDYRTIYSDGDVEFNSLLPMNQFSIDYFYYSLPSRLLLAISTSYNYQNKGITEDVTITKNNISQIQYKISPFEKSKTLLFLINKTFKKTPFAFKFSSFYNEIEKVNFLNNFKNNMQLSSYSGSLSLASKFKKARLNFEIGIKIKNNSYRFINNNYQSHYTKYESFFNLNGKINKNLIFLTNFNYIKLNSIVNQNNIFRFSPKLIYKNSKNKWEFSLVGHDIFNFNNATYIETSNYDSYHEENIFKTLSGYILLNTKYKF